MSMIGGEMAAEAALSSRRVSLGSEDRGLEPVIDWLHGIRAIPPMPVPRRGRVRAGRRPVLLKAEPAVAAEAHAESAVPPRDTRRLVLL